MRKRLGKALVVLVMVTVPAAYLVVAAAQSLGGTSVKERVAAATEPLEGRPDHTTRDIYELPIPAKATGKRYFETNSWRTSSLYARFTTVPEGLDWFLARIGTSQAALEEGAVPITPKQREAVGWTFTGEWAEQQHFYGLHLEPREDGLPSYNMVVNMADPEKPTVYIVSTITF